MSPHRSRLLGAFALVATFVVGALAGIVVDRSAGATPAPAAGQQATDGGDAESDDDGDDDRRGESKLLSRLQLSPTQDAAIDSILDRRRAQMEAYWDSVGPRFDAIVDSGRAEIRAVLSDAQREEYDRLRAERRRRHEDDHDGNQDD